MAGEAAGIKWHEITIASNPGARTEAERVVVEELEARGFNEESCFSIKLAMEEAVVNAMKHGNNFDETKNVMVRYGFNGDTFWLVVRDEGPGFDYQTVPDPTDEQHVDLPYGRGIMLMHAYMDEVHFNKKGNEVTMVRANRPEKKS